MLTLILIALSLLTLIASIFLPAVIGAQLAILGLSMLVLAVLVEMRKINKLLRK